MTRNLLLAGLVFCLFSVASPNVYGCSCVVDEVPDAFREARAVFVGEVIEIIEPRSDNPKAPLENQLYSIKFKVEKSWKGVHTSNIFVLSDQGRAGCFSWGPFLKGKKYLVYAERRTPGAPTRNLAVLFSCNRTDLLVNASEDFQKLPSFLQKTWGRK
jgi:hypothetical protein